MSSPLVIVGAGRAGRGLSRAFRAADEDVTLFGRRADPSDGVVAGPIPRERLARARVVLLTVRDAQIEGALSEVLAAAPPRATVVLAASGSAPPSALDPARRAGHAAGTFHPLLPLADPATVPEALRGAWIGIDGDASAITEGQRLAAIVGANTLRIPEGERARYHAAAVIASNFPTVLASLATDLLARAGVPAEQGWSATRRLLAAASENLEAHAPADALTGPVARGDAATVRRHLEALRDDPVILEIYAVLTRAAIGVAAQGNTSRVALDEIAAALDKI